MDPSIFQRLIDTWYDPLYRFALSLARNGDDALDLTQQTFARWAEKGGTLREAGKAKSWLFTVLYREFLDSRRVRRREVFGEVEAALDREPARSDAAQTKIDSTAALAALWELEEIFRVPITLFYLEPYQFTHAADFTARIVIQNALFKGRAKASALNIPWATYTSPEVAHVGLYEKQAKEKGIEVDTYTQELAKVDRAILDGETDGFARIHVRKGTDEILGATIVAAHAGDLISEVTLAMNGKLGLRTIGAAIHSYPTQAEAIRKTGDLYNRTRLTPLVKKLMGKWLSWQRGGA
jgi:RNA polymerase sigma factor (sigma-70 family)